MRTARVSVIGAGYWGVNLVRNFHALGRLETVYDTSAAARENLKSKFPGVNVSGEPAEAVRADKAGALVIAAPAAMHYGLARQGLEAGKDVFVEKPLALDAAEAKRLVELAEANRKILMVGHLLQYHPGMLKLKEMVSAGELGDLEYIYSNRVNLGKIRREENALWSFAPHDISVMLWMTGMMPLQVNAVGGAYLQKNVADTTVSTFTFDRGVRGHVYVSWLHPFKEQRLVVVGSKRMASFDDQAPKGRKLLIYDKKVSMVDGNFVAEKIEGAPVPFDGETEPLRAECEHFLRCVETRETPRTDGKEGLRVLKVLQSCQKSLETGGQPVRVTEHD